MNSKIPQKVIYAVMVVLDLTLHNGASPSQAKVIARRQGIPLRFIEHILYALKQAGLIESVRGCARRVHVESGFASTLLG